MRGETDMYTKFKDVDKDGLYFLLEDCLVRATDGAQSKHLEYVAQQLQRANEITEELNHRSEQGQSS